MLTMSPKEGSELTEASVATCDVFSKYLKEQIMEEIEADKVYITILYKVTR